MDASFQWRLSLAAMTAGGGGVGRAPWVDDGNSLAVVVGVASAAQDTGIGPGQYGLLWLSWDANPNPGRILFGPTNAVVASSASPPLRGIGYVVDTMVVPISGATRYWSFLALNNVTVLWNVQRFDATGELMG